MYAAKRKKNKGWNGGGRWSVNERKSRMRVKERDEP